MKFLLSRYLDATAWDREPRRHEAFLAAVRGSGELVDQQALADPSTYAVVRVPDGVRQVTEGPYPATGRRLAEYYLVDCESRERALELAALVPGARDDAVEVRPVMSPTGLEM